MPGFLLPDQVRDRFRRNGTKGARLCAPTFPNLTRLNSAIIYPISFSAFSASSAVNRSLRHLPLDSLRGESICVKAPGFLLPDQVRDRFRRNGTKGATEVKEIDCGVVAEGGGRPRTIAAVTPHTVSNWSFFSSS